MKCSISSGGTWNNIKLLHTYHSGPKNLKNTRENKYINKKYSEIAFLAVVNFFPTSKIDFWPFLKLQKMEFGQKNYS